MRRLTLAFGLLLLLRPALASQRALLAFSGHRPWRPTSRGGRANLGGTCVLGGHSGGKREKESPVNLIPKPPATPARGRVAMFHLLERGVRDMENVPADVQRTPAAVPPVERASSSGAGERVWMHSDSPHCCVYSGGPLLLTRSHLCKRFPCLQDVSSVRARLLRILQRLCERWK